MLVVEIDEVVEGRYGASRSFRRGRGGSVEVGGARSIRRSIRQSRAPSGPGLAAWQSLGQLQSFSPAPQLPSPHLAQRWASGAVGTHWPSMRSIAGMRVRSGQQVVNDLLDAIAPSPEQ